MLDSTAVEHFHEHRGVWLKTQPCSATAKRGRVTGPLRASVSSLNGDNHGHRKN